MYHLHIIFNKSLAQPFEFYTLDQKYFAFQLIIRNNIEFIVVFVKII